MAPVLRRPDDRAIQSSTGFSPTFLVGEQVSMVYYPYKGVSSAPTITRVARQIMYVCCTLSQAYLKPNEAKSGVVTTDMIRVML
jgi:hypothetical protein